MASTRQFPFNFEPNETIKSNNYTVGLNEYVHAIPLSPACTFDGNDFGVSCFSISNAASIVQYIIPKTGMYKVVTSTGSGGGTPNQAISIYGNDDSGTIQASAMFGNLSLGSFTSYFADGNLISTTMSPSGFNVPPTVFDFLFIVLMNSGASTRTKTITVRQIQLKENFYPSGTVLAGGDWIINKFYSIT